jgi:hypothetical protein
LGEKIMSQVRKQRRGIAAKLDQHMLIKIIENYNNSSVRKRNSKLQLATEVAATSGLPHGNGDSVLECRRIQQQSAMSIMDMNQHSLAPLKVIRDEVNRTE